MRYSGSEKAEIIQLVEQSSLPVKQTLKRLDIHRSTFYNWLKRYCECGIEALEDRKPCPVTCWNQVPQVHRDAIIARALGYPDLSPWELAVRYTGEPCGGCCRHRARGRRRRALHLKPRPVQLRRHNCRGPKSAIIAVSSWRFGGRGCGASIPQSPALFRIQ